VTAQEAFATTARFALESAETDSGKQLTVFTSLAKVAEGLNLSAEKESAEAAEKALRRADEAQMTFEGIINMVLGGKMP
jgi:hypothetical protein